jgi:hypothetical protein
MHNSRDGSMPKPSLTATERVNPSALSVADVARLLGLPVEAVGKDIVEGVPAASLC